ncbi:MAG: peptidoglycan editing factor PgeF [Balneolaceae bacterium]
MNEPVGGYGNIKGLNLGLNSEENESIVQKNYDLLFDETGWNQNQLIIARQVHSNNIKSVQEPGIVEGVDGLVTDREDLLLGIQVADCAAILIADPNPVHPVIGAFHAGWRGAVAGIVGEGLNEMINLGGNPAQCKAFISPCISVDNFEVGEEIASKFPSEYCDYNHFDKPHLNLKAFLRDQLLECGVKEPHIETSPFCTIDDDRFYSYRRERDQSGRMLGVIRISPKK